LPKRKKRKRLKKRGSGISTFARTAGFVTWGGSCATPSVRPRKKEGRRITEKKEKEESYLYFFTDQIGPLIGRRESSWEGKQLR